MRNLHHPVSSYLAAFRTAGLIVLDCIDNMTAKVHLLETCVKRGQYVVSAMGAGGRLDRAVRHS